MHAKATGCGLTAWGLMAGLALAAPAWGMGGDAGAVAGAVTAQDKAQSAWLARTLGVTPARALLPLMNAWVSAAPQQAAPWVALAQAHYWLGLQLQDEGAPPEDQRAAFGDAVTAAVTARRWDPNNPGGPFWEAVNRAKVAELRGIVASAGELPALMRLMDRVKELSPCYFHGGVYRYWGAVVTRTPDWLVRLQGKSLQDAEEQFKKSQKCDPEFVGTPRYWAELKLKAGDVAGARLMLNQGLHQPPAQDPDTQAWNLHEKLLCRKLLQSL